MKKNYLVYEFISQSDAPQSNNRSVRLERVEGPDLTAETAEKLDQKAPGASSMLKQMDKAIMTAGFATEQEANDFINNLEIDEKPGQRKRFCIVSFPS